MRASRARSARRRKCPRQARKPQRLRAWLATQGQAARRRNRRFRRQQRVRSSCPTASNRSRWTAHAELVRADAASRRTPSPARYLTTEPAFLTVFPIISELASPVAQITVVFATGRPVRPSKYSPSASREELFAGPGGFTFFGKRL